MSNTKEKLLEMGCKIWSKSNVSRVYVKAEHVKKLINFEAKCAVDCFLEKNTKAIFQRINSEGAWFNVESNKLESKKASVQYWFETSEFKELFGY